MQSVSADPLRRQFLTMKDRFLFIGGDKRMEYAADFLSKKYFVDMVNGADMPEGKYEYIVLPLPVSRDGVYINAPLSETPLPFQLISQYAAEHATVFCGGANKSAEDICRTNGLRFVNYFSDEPLTLKNAALTAESAAAILANCNDSSVFGADIAITGGGRVAVYTARLLKAFGASVTICARSIEQRTKAELDGFYAVDTEELSTICSKADFIVNTVPAELFDESTFTCMKRGAVYLELATLPPEPYKSRSEQYGVQYIYAPGLPGKYSPKTAGELIAETILAEAEKLSKVN